MIVSSITAKLIYRFSQSQPHLQNFTHISSIPSPTRNLTLHQYSHNQTKARVYHFESEDREKAYASIIKTFVTNSKGCPHILEHLACCGSDKYPIRDPFFNMIKRSVNSYMNAWTGDDFTAYPFASANAKDW
jgi:Zn-dependent M16 (insulinase) family peptidase